MKILFPIGTIYPSQQGGPSNTIYWLAKYLHKKSIEVVIVATNLGIKDSTIKHDTWQYTDFGKVRYTKDRWHNIPLKLIYYSLRELKSADIVHLNSIFYPPSWIIAFFTIIFTQKKIFWSIRGNLEEKALLYSKWRKKTIISFIKRLSDERIVFHATSELEMLNTHKIFGITKRVINIPNYLELPNKVAINNKLEENYFLYIGRIHPIKALDNLIQALALSINFKNSNFILKIVGNCNTDYSQLLKDLVLSLNLERKIQFIGHIEGEYKQILYSNAYFTILPSHNENFGNVIIESLAQGTPVVASFGTPWEILEKFNAGYWISNSPKELAALIDKLLDIKDKDYNALRRNAYELSQKYDISQAISYWIEEYKK